MTFSHLVISAAVAVAALCMGPAVAAAHTDRAATNCAITHPRSIEGVVATHITFVNDTSGTVDVDWLNYHGNRVFYYTLQPHTSYVQQTWVTHPWVAIDRATGVCVGYTVARTDAFVYHINGSTTSTPTAPTCARYIV